MLPQLCKPKRSKEIMNEALKAMEVKSVTTSGIISVCISLWELLLVFFCETIKDNELKKWGCFGVKRGAPYNDRTAQGGSVEY